MSVDVHQHLWPAPFIAALRARSQPPRLDGWTLELLGDERFEMDPDRQDPVARADGDDMICLAASSALGIDRLAPEESAELAEAWLSGVLALGEPFRAWATAGVIDPDPASLSDAIARGAIGLEVAADVLAAPDGLERLAPLLDVLGDRPVLVHPGPTSGEGVTRPPWWVATVSYVSQLHAAWWAWADGGRGRYPQLPVCFAALGGLGPLHGERHRARGGSDSAVDPLTFVETSSYGIRAVDAVLRVLGIDVICRGSDLPYAAPAPLALDPAARHAIASVNPARLLAAVLKEVPV